MEEFSRKASEPTVRGLGTASLYFTKPCPATPHASPRESPSTVSLPISVDVWQGLLGSVAHLPMELGEVQLLRLQVPGGTTRGRGRATNVRQKAWWVGRGAHPQPRTPLEWSSRYQIFSSLQLMLPKHKFGLAVHSAGIPTTTQFVSCLHLRGAGKRSRTKQTNKQKTEHKMVLWIG